MVKILRYQQHTQYRTMWAASGETREDLLVRAEILLNPEGGFYHLVIPEVQPDASCIHCMVIPLWWPENGIFAFIVSSSEDSEDTYLAVSLGDDTIEDVLPPAYRHRAQRVDVYLSEPQTTGPISDPSNWEGRMHGTVLHMQATGSPPPVFRSATAILNDPLNDRRQSNLPDAIAAPTHRYLLLGAGDFQAPVTLREGPVAPQLATYVDMLPERMVIWVQRELFEQVSVRGLPVHRCMAFRSRADIHCRTVRAVFVDSRRLGLPVCCRIIPQARMRASDFFTLLDTEGYRAQFAGGELDPDTAECRIFPHCSSAILWWSVSSIAGRVRLHGILTMSVMRMLRRKTEGGTHILGVGML